MNPAIGIILLVGAVVAMITTSIFRRRRRPTDAEVLKLAKALLGAGTSIAVIVSIVRHAQDVASVAYVIAIGMIAYAYQSLCALYDVSREMWAPEVPALPKAAESALRARVSAVTSGSEAEQEASPDADGDGEAARNSSGRS